MRNPYDGTPMARCDYCGGYCDCKELCDDIRAKRDASMVSVPGRAPVPAAFAAKFSEPPRTPAPPEKTETRKIIESIIKGFYATGNISWHQMKRMLSALD